MSSISPVHLLRGSDPILLADQVKVTVDELVGDDDRSLVLDEFTGADYDLGAVADAARTPPLFGTRRVVLARGAGRFSKADDVAPLIEYLHDPLETSAIVLVWEMASSDARLSTVPKKLAEALQTAGGVTISTDPASTRAGKDAWWSETFQDAPVHLDAGAQRLIRDHVGDDLSAVPALLRLLAAAHGVDAAVHATAVEPYLSAAGSVPPWDLTDAIENGDTSAALDVLARMLGAGERPPLAVMASLSSTYLRIAALDGADVSNERDAAALLGMKGSTFPAKKALATARRLGASGTRRAIELCAQADLTLRGGGVAWPGELVLEVLVARLCRVHASNQRAGRRRG